MSTAVSHRHPPQSKRAVVESIDDGEKEMEGCAAENLASFELGHADVNHFVLPSSFVTYTPSPGISTE